MLWCDPDRIRTCDPQLRRLLLYPAELPDQSFQFVVRRADDESGCKDNAFFWKSNSLDSVNCLSLLFVLDLAYDFNAADQRKTYYSEDDG